MKKSTALYVLPKDRFINNAILFCKLHLFKCVLAYFKLLMMMTVIIIIVIEIIITNISFRNTTITISVIYNNL